MLKLCGKSVSILGNNQGKTVEQPSTGSHGFIAMRRATCEEVASSHSFTCYFPPRSSTEKHRPPHLGEHYFYPVSTAPTNTSTKEK